MRKRTKARSGAPAPPRDARHVALLHNAKAGDEEYSVHRLLILLRDAGYEAECFPLKEALADRLLRKKALAHGEMVVVAGGDGSIRRVAERLVGKGRRIAPLPLGTANNIARGLGIAGSPEEVIAGWARPVERKVDAGIARGPWGVKRFIEGLGLGLIGRAIAIIEDLDRASKHEFASAEEKLHRDLCVMSALGHEVSPVPVKLRADGERERDDFLLLEILNIQHAGPGIELAAKADPGDGWLDLVTVATRERGKLVRSIEQSLSESRRATVLASRQVRKVRMTVGRCELRLDDQVLLRRDDFAAAGKGAVARIEVEIVPGALDFVLPGDPAPA